MEASREGGARLRTRWKATLIGCTSIGVWKKRRWEASLFGLWRPPRLGVGIARY
jgi:hypothetical protein